MNEPKSTMADRWRQKSRENSQDVVICLSLFGREFAVTFSDTGSYDNPLDAKVEEYHPDMDLYTIVNDELSSIEYAAIEAAVYYIRNED